VAANGRESVEQLRRIPYDLVLMDVQMPEMDGLEATRKIRASVDGATSARVPIIALTAHAMASDRARCLGAGMNDYVAKPIAPHLLAQAIERWTGKHCPADEPPISKAQGSVAAIDSVNLSVFDQASLLTPLEGDRAAAAMVVGAFLDDMPRQMGVLESFVKIGDGPGVARQAHVIRNAAATVGGIAVKAVALKLEQAAKAGDLASAKPLLVELQCCLEDLKVAMAGSTLLRVQSQESAADL
jgi:CheY-like chemotaxis protein/HPt (histidine-containing phosphotransfer) domain-containing protein